MFAKCVVPCPMSRSASASSGLRAAKISSQLKQVIVIRNQRFTDAATQESPRIAHIRCADFFVVFVAAEQVRRLNKHRVIAFVRQFSNASSSDGNNFAARFQLLRTMLLVYARKTS